MSDAATQLIESARSLAPLLAGQASESESLRRPTDEAIRALREAGIFDLLVPRCYGGMGLDLDTFLEVGLALGEGDASLAWVANFYIEHNWILCQFPKEFQEKLYANSSHILAPAMVAPTGRATPCEGGFRVNGRWNWATGAMHGSWVLVASLAGAEGEIDPRFLALPVEEVTIDDVWFMDGMCGTGSNDVVIDDVFVPAAQTLSLIDLAGGTAPGSKVHSAPLYHTPMIPILTLAATMPALGQAKAVLRGYRERIVSRTQYLGARTHSEKDSAQIRLGEFDLVLTEAELLLRDVIREVMELRDSAPIETRARWMAAFARVVHQSRDVVQAVALASGGSAHKQGDPLQRATRDLNVLSTHVVFTLDDALMNYGRAQLGVEIQNALL